MTAIQSELKKHWDGVYSRIDPSQATWHQEDPAASLALIERTGVTSNTPIIDVGGGASLLADRLMKSGYRDVSVLDISSAALATAGDRLGAAAARIHWIESDITSFIPDRAYGLWHDRAVFHFLTDPVDRALYIAVLQEALEDDGFALFGTFALDGPDRCSGRDVVQYDAASLQAELGPCFELMHTERELHVAPSGVKQQFAWHAFVKRAFPEDGLFDM